MIKKQIYPKTQRVSVSEKMVTITEKIDGSNLCIFKKDDEIYVAQRNNIIAYSEIEDATAKQMLYKGLFNWLNTNINELKNSLLNNAVLCGEWVAMGKLKYPELIHTFNMFAKANIDDNFDLKNIYYNHELFIYPFENQQIPSCINIVPIVSQLKTYPTKEHLDEIYSNYCNQEERNIEGFVVEYLNGIKKYVRMKNGKLEEHKEKGE